MRTILGWIVILAFCVFAACTIQGISERIVSLEDAVNGLNEQVVYIEENM